ncbi:RsfA family transcriptional regulator [Pontibacillus yanchengensis]|uniref:RsfA family transcriptional regulator n=2 Tax=Pontibacillus yanchengensis TaxID=462910 RepID=A0ACC7VBS2_9BACI|nr:RsfA family transcriptional regulator [Pontibacillus yanchengensis]MYL33035.1 RsfA family transcriptional regulator [Pontibacillus yanchengensis]MYL52115.1 RsfA family transcriptional regulator [Pontibacillus yanchengensis]
MNATRQDAWTQDEDVLLAETVLRYIRVGGTQLEAFEEVAKRLSRTSAACGFRWNATVRKQYQKGIQLAKEERKKSGKGQIEKVISQPSNQNREEDQFSIDDAISFLENMKQTYTINPAKTQEEKMEELTKENEALKEQMKRYRQAWEEIGNVWKWVYTNQQKG